MILTFFFFNDTATTEIYTLSLHDALPISLQQFLGLVGQQVANPLRTRFRGVVDMHAGRGLTRPPGDRKSTRLNSSHPSISYAVFCLKKKKKLIYGCAWLGTSVDVNVYK